MRILFWNLKGNSNEGLLSKLLQENAVDIAIFAEYQGTSFNKVLEALDQEYVQYDGYGACEKITLVCKKAISTTVKREQNRYTLYSSDPYNASDYAHAEDFYEWYYDDFYDYEEAEEYWEEHGG